MGGISGPLGTEHRAHNTGGSGEAPRLPSGGQRPEPFSRPRSLSLQLNLPSPSRFNVLIKWQVRGTDPCRGQKV